MLKKQTSTAASVDLTGAYTHFKPKAPLAAANSFGIVPHLVIYQCPRPHFYKASPSIAVGWDPSQVHRCPVSMDPFPYTNVKSIAFAACLSSTFPGRDGRGASNTQDLVCSCLSFATEVPFCRPSLFHFLEELNSNVTDKAIVVRIPVSLFMEVAARSFFPDHTVSTKCRFSTKVDSMYATNCSVGSEICVPRAV